MKETNNLSKSKNDNGINSKKEETILYKENPSENIVLKIKSYEEKIEEINSIIIKVGTDENNNDNDNQKKKQKQKQKNNSNNYNTRNSKIKKKIFTNDKSNILIYSLKFK